MLIHNYWQKKRWIKGDAEVPYHRTSRMITAEYCIPYGMYPFCDDASHSFTSSPLESFQPTVAAFVECICVVRWYWLHVVLCRMGSQRYYHKYWIVCTIEYVALVCCWISTTLTQAQRICGIRKRRGCFVCPLAFWQLNQNNFSSILTTTTRAHIHAAPYLCIRKRHDLCFHTYTHTASSLALFLSRSLSHSLSLSVISWRFCNAAAPVENIKSVVVVRAQQTDNIHTSCAVLVFSCRWTVTQRYSSDTVAIHIQSVQVRQRAFFPGVLTDWSFKEIIWRERDCGLFTQNNHKRILACELAAIKYEINYYCERGEGDKVPKQKNRKSKLNESVYRWFERKSSTFIISQRHLLWARVNKMNLSLSSSYEMQGEIWGGRHDFLQTTKRWSVRLTFNYVVHSFRFSMLQQVMWHAYAKVDINVR